MSRRSPARSSAPSRARRIAAPLLFATALLTGACGGDDATSPDEAIAGTYVLTGLAQGTLPLVVEPIGFGGAVELTGATLALEPDGLARDVRRFRYGDGRFG